MALHRIRDIQYYIVSLYNFALPARRVAISVLLEWIRIGLRLRLRVTGNEGAVLEVGVVLVGTQLWDYLWVVAVLVIRVYGLLKLVFWTAENWGFFYTLHQGPGLAN